MRAIESCYIDEAPVLYFARARIRMKTCSTCYGSYPDSFMLCPQDGTPLTQVDAWSDGAVIRGKYRILSKIGQGGMGTVYKALHLRFQELRALKVMSPQLMNDQAFVKRFEHEALFARKLQHPNVVRVEDIDEAEDGQPFIVMEYIEGRSLKKLVETESPLPAGLLDYQASGLGARCCTPAWDGAPRHQTG